MPPHLYTCTDSPFIPDTELSSSNEKMKKTQSFLWRHSQSNDKHGVSQGDERYSVDRVQATWGPKGGSGHLQEIKTTLLLLLRWLIIFTSTGATNWSWFAQDLPILGIESPKSQETPLLGANQRADRPVLSCHPPLGPRQICFITSCSSTSCAIDPLKLSDLGLHTDVPPPTYAVL